MPKPIQVFEHDRLLVGEQGFEAKHFEALVRYNDQHGCVFFKVGHRRIQFSSFVGVIQVGNLAIEILPKAEKGALVDKGKWQRALLQMLRQVGWLDVEAAPDADLHLRHSSLIDLYLAAFLGEVERLTHAGLVKKYRTTEANLYKLKGRILFRQHVSRNLLHRERMYTAHETYDRDNIFNRVLKCALGIVEQQAVRPALTARATALNLAFERVSDSRITPDTFERLVPSRNTERYRKAIQLARLIILNYSPDLRGGREHVVAILFDMNKLFERFILVHLRRAQGSFANHRLHIQGQQSKRFWASKNIRPDVVVNFDQRRVIIDAKWKMPKHDLPDDDDLKQMYVYNLHFGGHRSILLYPRAGPEQNEQRQPFAVSDSPPDGLPVVRPHECATHYVDLFGGDQRLRPDIGKQLIERVIMAD